jgi:uncharacterized protein YjbI with pentapeptide repeats
MEVLTAFVRENAPAPVVESRIYRRWEVEEEEVEKEGDEEGAPDAKRSTDVQAILTVLGRRSEKNRRDELQPLDLSGTDLRGMTLKGAVFEKTLFYGAWLNAANMIGGHFSEAEFGGTRLRFAQACDADFSKAYMRFADFKGADLTRAKMINTELEYAIFKYAITDETVLTGANLPWATYFTQDHLDGAIVNEQTILPNISSIGSPKDGIPF